MCRLCGPSAARHFARLFATTAIEVVPVASRFSDNLNTHTNEEQERPEIGCQGSQYAVGGREPQFKSDLVADEEEELLATVRKRLVDP